MRGLPLRASFLQYGQRVQEYLWFLPDHIHYHEDHLLFFVWNLIKTEGWQVQFIVHLEDIFKSWQCVYNVPVINLRMFINFHASCTAAHFL